MARNISRGDVPGFLAQRTLHTLQYLPQEMYLRTALPNDDRVDALVVIRQVHLNRLEDGLLVADKVEGYLRMLDAESISTRILLLPPARFDPKRASRPLRTAEMLKLRSLVKGALASNLDSLPPTTHQPRRVDLARLSFWRSVLDRTRPRAVLGIGLTTALCAEAAVRGVATIELQHGYVQPGLRDKYWPARYWAKPYPDLFVAWDSDSAQLSNTEGIESVAVGHPSPYAPGPTSDGHPEGPTRVVATLQYGFTDGLDPLGMITPRMDESLRALSDSPDKFRVTLRLHPVVTGNRSLKKSLEWIQGRYPNAQVCLAPARPLLEQLAEADVHLTHMSAAVMEAAMVGTPSVVLAEALDATVPGVMLREPYLLMSAPPTVIADVLHARSNPPAPYAQETRDSFADVIKRYLR